MAAVATPDAHGIGRLLAHAPGACAAYVSQHSRVRAMEGYKSLREGQKVEFDVSQGPKGLQAAKIREFN